MSPPLRKAPTHTGPRFDRNTPIKIALLIAAVLAFFQVSGWIADALGLQGFSRGWSFVIVLTGSYLAAAAWRALRKRRKAIEQAQWKAGLADGFADRLEQARQEAQPWKEEQR